MNPLTKLNHIPWKYVLGMNLSIVALAVTFVSLQPATTTTEQRSQAKEKIVSATPTPKVVIDPSHLPELVGPDIGWAKVGDAVVVKGKNLGRVPFGTLFIGDIEIPRGNIVSWEDNQVVITIPENAKTNVITLKHELGTTTTKTVLEITKTNLQ